MIIEQSLALASIAVPFEESACIVKHEEFPMTDIDLDFSIIYTIRYSCAFSIICPLPNNNKRHCVINYLGYNVLPLIRGMCSNK
jgi:hypothetical protein